jgi:crotonobetainyl-CoA:carnitine CoA-transferase CaiB-like acyl-CoA transferase
MERALDGVTIADFTQMMQGPWATQKLAEMGADVIKIEPPGGEWERTLPAGGDLYDGVSPYFLAMNRNKRSITLDLKSEAGHQAALDIISEADVMLNNFRRGVMDRLGLGYDDVQAVNPDIVYVTATGFGETGPHTDRPGQDLLLQAMSGLTTITGDRDDPPIACGSPVVDEHAAMLIAFHTMTALFHQARTGEGQKVEVNLLNAAIDFQCQEVTAELIMDQEFERSESGIANKYIGAPYGIYETEDGYVAIAMSPMDAVAEALDAPEIAEWESQTAIYEERDEIKPLLEAHTRTYGTEELLDALLDEDVWASAVNDYYEMAEDPQVQHNEMIVDIDHPKVGSFRTTGLPVNMSATPAEITSPPPGAGEHTEEILRECGYDDETIEDLRDSGVAGE